MFLFELQYFPPVTFVSALYKNTHVYLDIYEIYRKMSFRNRCLVAGAGGVISLSIPLRDGRNQMVPMREVMISDTEDWQARHFKSICSAYNRSPFFEHYADELEMIYRQPVRLLAEWNLACLNWLHTKLDWPAEIRFTENPIPFQAESWEDKRNLVLPKNYGRWNPVKYRQVFEERTGFFPNLSVLDLLFNTGKQAGELLRNANLEF
jgi:hypothetical protein